MLLGTDQVRFYTIMAFAGLRRMLTLQLLHGRRYYTWRTLWQGNKAQAVGDIGETAVEGLSHPIDTAEELGQHIADDYDAATPEEIAGKMGDVAPAVVAAVATGGLAGAGAAGGALEEATGGALEGAGEGLIESGGESFGDEAGAGAGDPDWEPPTDPDIRDTDIDGESPTQSQETQSQETESQETESQETESQEIQGGDDQGDPGVPKRFKSLNLPADDQAAIENEAWDDHVTQAGDEKLAGDDDQGEWEEPTAEDDPYSRVPRSQDPTDIDGDVTDNENTGEKTDLNDDDGDDPDGDDSR
jgi:hypothetical protein